MERVKIGIVGIGNMGASHAKKLLEGKCPQAELTAVADTSPERLAWAKRELGGETAFFDSAQALFRHRPLDAVLIATPHYDHPGLAMEAFEQGLHVLLEKPAGVYTKQVRAMNDAAQHARLTFGIMFQQRLSPAFMRMRSLVHGGTLGAVRRTNWIVTNWYRSQAYYDSGAWRATWAGEGGGVLLNQCPHNLDLWQWICGMPQKVTAHCHVAKWHDIEVEDDVSAYVEYGNGATGTFVTSTGDYPGSNRFEITMDRGKLLCEDAERLTVWELSEAEQDFSKRAKQSFERPSVTKITYEFPKAEELHMGVIAAFADAVRSGTPLVAHGSEGINSLTLSNAMYLSSWTESAVTLPMDEELFLRGLQQRSAVSKHKQVTPVFADTEGTYR